MKKHGGGVGMASSFLTSVLDGGKLHVPAALPAEAESAPEPVWTLWRKEKSYPSPSLHRLSHLCSIKSSSLYFSSIFDVSAHKQTSSSSVTDDNEVRTSRTSRFTHTRATGDAREGQKYVRRVCELKILVKLVATDSHTYLPPRSVFAAVRRLEQPKNMSCLFPNRHLTWGALFPRPLTEGEKKKKKTLCCLSFKFRLFCWQQCQTFPVCFKRKLVR
jgi:hypothetical protein